MGAQYAGSTPSNERAVIFKPRASSIILAGHAVGPVQKIHTRLLTCAAP